MRNTRMLMFVAALATTGLGPCGPFPGGLLAGEEMPATVEDWSFANDVPRCAVEVRPDDPHSVTVNCMSTGGRLFVSCSECAGKTWAAIAVDEPRGRIRIAKRVYPVRLRRVVDADELDRVWKARADKLDQEAGDRPAAWWTFELRSR